MFSAVTDPLQSRGYATASSGSTLRIHAGVMMAGASPPSRRSTSDSTAWAAREAAAATAGPSNVRDVLRTPVDLDSDPAVAHAEPEKTRQRLAAQADIINTEKRRLKAVVREYNAAHDIVPCAIDPAVIEELRVIDRAAPESWPDVSSQRHLPSSRSRRIALR